MKNKNYRNLLIKFISINFIFLVISLFINFTNISKYQYTNNILINNIIGIMKENNEYNEETIIELLNNDESYDASYLLKYGIDVNKTNISIKETKIIKKNIIINIILFCLNLISCLLLLKMYDSKNNKKINEVTKYLEQINNNDYDLDILKNSEDELSILKNEIYKTAVKLNEQSNLLLEEKNILKDSLSDISHQLKTPLTSVSLLTEQLKNNDNLTIKQQKDILNNIHRKINNTNFLVYSLLKLSKFDANTITFIRKDYLIKDILQEAIENVSILSELKNIKIITKGDLNSILHCDFKWEIEALTNIIKNCLEHSFVNSKIEIFSTTNDIFTKIVIKDYGNGINQKDLKHIFERFYKGENASSSSIGIGLALAKTIIEKDNGYITVTSKLNKGTTFTIKYLK